MHNTVLVQKLILIITLHNFLMIMLKSKYKNQNQKQNFKNNKSLRIPVNKLFC